MTMLPFGQVAPVKRRAVAYIIDALIAAVIPVLGAIIAIVMTVSALSSGEPTGTLFALGFVVMPIVGILTFGWMLVYTFMQTGRGSVGMRAQGLRLASAADGSPISFWRALLRNIVFGLAGSIVVGYFSPLFDGSGRFQGWHDKAVGSVMIDQKSYRAERMPQEMNAAAAPLVPDRGPAPMMSSAPTSMPGFAAPLAPTSMPGFAAPSPAAAPAPAADPASVVPPTPQAAVSPDHAAPEAVMQPSVDEEVAEQTVLTPHLTRDLPDDPLISFVPGITQEPVRREEPPAPAAVAPEPEPEPHPEPDAEPHPQLEPEIFEDEDFESTRISVPGHRLVFTWDDGQRAMVSGRTVFGRNPEEGDGAANVAVRDETRSLSKTHFEAGADARGGWVLDRQSTNGTSIVRDGVRIACPPGQRVPVRLGDALEIGDRIVTIGGYA